VIAAVVGPGVSLSGLPYLLTFPTNLEEGDASFGAAFAPPYAFVFAPAFEPVFVRSCAEADAAVSPPATNTNNPILNTRMCCPVSEAPCNMRRR
jgi:hypothetical protein